MSESASAWFMIGLNIVMIVYTLWVLSLSKPEVGARIGVGAGLLVWLAILHWGISQKTVFPAEVSSLVFLISIFLFVGMVGLLLFFVPSVRRTLLELDQRQLLLLQGIRVFFGATFLMQASLGVLPVAFGIVDGFTHIGAGFFGLIAAFSFAADVQAARRAWFANLFGLADILVVAGSLALILLPQIGPHHSMMYAVFLPAPLWLWFHLVSIRKLIRNDNPAYQAARA